MGSRQLARVAPETPEAILAAHLDSWEAHVSAWISRREDMGKNQFLMGLVASSVETQYGAKSLAKFAADVNESSSTVYLYRDVYRKCYQFSKRLENLSWSHFAVTVKSELQEIAREQLLTEAADGGWSTRQLKREIGVRKIASERGPDAPEIDPQMASAISHWREIRPSIIKFAEANPQFWAYTDDYISDVDEAINTPWESAREYIERLIFGGYREIEFLAQASHWTKETVERLCNELVALGTHEWRDKGGKADDARGARPRLIVPIEEPSGDAYEAYHGDRMSIIQDEDD